MSANGDDEDDRVDAVLDHIRRCVAVRFPCPADMGKARRFPQCCYGTRAKCKRVGANNPVVSNI
jgi:hypothetical protein